MKNLRIRALLFLLFLSLMPLPASAEEYGTGLKITEIRKTSVNTKGLPLEYLATDKPEVTVLSIEIPPGEETGWHLHPVPVYAYILSGELDLEMDTGDHQVFHRGEAIIESMNTPHNGRNKGTEPVSLIAIYTGEKGSPTTKKIRGNRIEYTADGIAMKGYLAYDERFRGKRPGVLVVPEWWGNNEYARRRAIMLAEIGYAALVVDMYGDGRVAETPDEAGKLAAEATKAPETAKSRFIAAMNLLKQQPVVDPQRIGAIGYCFGGGVVLNIAKQGVDLKGVVSFHGSMPKGEPAKAGAVRAKLLVLHGGADTAVKPEQVEAFKKEMTEAGADFRLITYPGAKHSFTNAEADRYAAKFHLPAGYNREADEKSWKEMKLFLKEVFRTQDRQ